MNNIKIWNETPKGYKREYDKDANDALPYMEEFVINDGKKHSCFIVLPGGGYDHLADHEGAPFAKALNKLGISCFVLHYRVAPYLHPIYLYDVKRAVRYVRYNAEKYNIIEDKIGIMGFSAGAHLSCLCAQNFDKFEYQPEDDVDKVSARPDALCLCYPVISVTKDIQHERSGKNLCGDDEEIRKALSCELNVREDMPPTFIWHTFEDKSVDCRNSVELAMALKEKNVKFELHIFPDGRHGLGFADEVEGTNKWFGLFTDWLKRLEYH
jgi:acetyl esterase/lipase